MEANEVHLAFEMLLEEVEVVGNSLDESGAEAFRGRLYDKARELIGMATRLATFRQKLRALQEEWSSLFAPRLAPAAPAKVKRRRLGPKLTKGLRTPDDAFRHPILESLAELGGSAPAGDVLDRVLLKMKGTLNDHDFQPLRSSPKSLRWRNTAQWSRNSLVTDGLMKADSPFGTWEISDRGRAAIRQGKS